MKLTTEQMQATNLLTPEGYYDCCLIQQRFAYKLFRNNASSMGDVIMFDAHTKIGPLSFADAIVIAVELPATTIFGGVCFARLYAAQLGSVLSALLNVECTVDESCIFIDDKQASVSMINQVKESVLINFIFPLQEDNTEEAFYTLKMDCEQKTNFEISVIESFKQLTRSIFIETRRDNF